MGETIQHICKIVKRAALLTCVSNAGGLGPGHTAVVLDSHIYTIERVKGAWAVAGSGWLKIKTAVSKTYFTFPEIGKGGAQDRALALLWLQYLGNHMTKMLETNPPILKW